VLLPVQEMSCGGIWRDLLQVILPAFAQKKLTEITKDLKQVSRYKGQKSNR